MIVFVFHVTIIIIWDIWIIFLFTIKIILLHPTSLLHFVTDSLSSLRAQISFKDLF